MFKSTKKETVTSNNETELLKAKISPAERIKDIIDFNYIPAENEYSIRELQRALKVVFYKIETANAEAEAALARKVDTKKAYGFSNCSPQCYNAIGRIGIHFYNPLHKIVTFELKENGDICTCDDSSVEALGLAKVYKNELRNVIQTRDNNNAAYFDTFNFEELEVINFKGASAFPSPIKPSYVFMIEGSKETVKTTLSFNILNGEKYLSTNSLSWQDFFESNEKVLLDNCYVNVERFPQMLKDELKNPSKMVASKKARETKKRKSEIAIA